MDITIPESVLDFARKHDYEAGPPFKTLEDYKVVDTRIYGSHIPVALVPDFPPIAKEKMLKEIDKLRNNFVPHRGGDSEGWESLTLYGLSSTHTQAHHKYGYKDYCPENKWTDVCQYLPACVKYIKRLPYKKFNRVRIMKVVPGGYIRPHTDRSLWVGGALNIAINNPDDCKFYVEDHGYLPFDKSYAIFPNTGMNHSVVNNSGEDRYHFIVHGEHAPQMNKWKEQAIEITCQK